MKDKKFFNDHLKVVIVQAVFYILFSLFFSAINFTLPWSNKLVFEKVLPAMTVHGAHNLIGIDFKGIDLRNVRFESLHLGYQFLLETIHYHYFFGNNQHPVQYHNPINETFNCI